MAAATTIALGAAAVAAPIVGGVVGQQMSKKDRERAAAAQQAAIGELERVGIPTIEAQQIVLQNPQLVYNYMPELEAAETLGPSELRDVESQLSPETRDAQMKALAALQQRGEAGFTEKEMSDIRRIQDETSKAEQARQGQILQQMAARGAAGSGQELAAKLSSSQAAANTERQQADTVRGEAMQRALEAIAQAGSLGGQVRQQEYGIKSDAARAQDVISEFNLRNRAGVQQRNVGSKNEAQAKREQLRQELENQRAATANAQEQYNKQLIQQDYMNRMNKAQGIANARLGQAAGLQQQAANTAASYAGMGAAAGSGAAAGLGYLGETKSATPAATPTAVAATPTDKEVEKAFSNQGKV